jgi:hypothetical protein
MVQTVSIHIRVWIHLEELISIRIRVRIFSIRAIPESEY